MNLDDLILVRGWINHIAWSALAEQVPEGEAASARQRLKDLRRQLARKARFYGKPEQVTLWLGERGVTETWSRHALAALTKLNSLAEPVPDLNQAVERWFPEAVCAALPATVNTLAALIDYLEAIYAGDRRCPDALKPSLKHLTGFFEEHARTLGYQLNKTHRRQPSRYRWPRWHRWSGCGFRWH